MGVEWDWESRHTPARARLLLQDLSHGVGDDGGLRGVNVLGHLLDDFVEDGGVDLEVDVGEAVEVVGEGRDGVVDAVDGGERVGDDLVRLEVGEVELDETGAVKKKVK